MKSEKSIFPAEESIIWKKNVRKDIIAQKEKSAQMRGCDPK